MTTHTADWQRPPFEPGNELSTVHGSRSPRRVDVLAAELAAALLSHEECPEYLHQARFSDAVEAWAFTAAVVRLLRSWLASQDIETALSESTTALEETTLNSGRSSKRTSGRRVQSALDALHRAETRANSLRRELGLTPGAVARMGLDLSEKKDSLMHQLLRLQVEQQRGNGDGDSDGDAG